MLLSHLAKRDSPRRTRCTKAGSTLHLSGIVISIVVISRSEEQELEVAPSPSAGSVWVVDCSVSSSLGRTGEVMMLDCNRCCWENGAFE